MIKHSAGFLALGLFVTVALTSDAAEGRFARCPKRESPLSCSPPK